MLKAPIGKRIAVIAPHPDDESIGPGGLLLAHRGKATVHLIFLTNGEKGGALESEETDSKANISELVEARRKEAQDVSQKLGAASLDFCGFPDGGRFVNEANCVKLRSILRTIDPDVVLVPWFLDEHPDHQQANVLFARACQDWNGLVLGYEIWTLLEPNALFDISDYIEEKLALIAGYESQLRTVDYLAYTRSLSGVRAFHFPVRSKRSGAVEAYFCLPSLEYRELVLSVLIEDAANR